MPDAAEPIKQYCRYCVHCVVKPDFDIWCSKQEKNVIEKSAKAKNYCKDYEHTPYDAYNPQNLYRPDVEREKTNQTDLFNALFPTDPQAK